MNVPLVFIDTETVGLDPITDQIWEIAAIRREPDGTEAQLHLLVDHERPGPEYLASDFAADYNARWNPNAAVTRKAADADLRWFCRDKAHLIGAVPSFDAERLGHMRRYIGLNQPDPWHYHLIDVETLVVGYLRGSLSAAEPPDLPWDSDDLSRAVGVDPDDFARHTALGDVLWALAIYDAVMGDQS